MQQVARRTPDRITVKPAVPMDGCPDPFVVIDRSGQTLSKNEAWGAFGGDWIDRVHPADQADARNALRSVDEDQPASIRLRMADRGGSWRHVDWRLWRADRIYGVGRDVQEDVEELRRLKASETQMLTIFDTSQEGVWMIDLGGITTYVNPRMAEILGTRPDKMIGHPIQEWMDEPEREQAQRNLARRRAGKADRMDFRYRRADGSHVHTILSAGPVLGEDGEPVGAIGMVTDITDRREAEEKLKVLRDELEKRVAERTRSLARAVDDMEAFTYTVSHDLRAPLRTLAGFSQLLLDRRHDLLDEDSRRHLEYIGQAAKNMTELIEGLLRFARLGRQAIRRKTVDVDRMVRGIARPMQEEFPDVSYEQAPLPACVADPLLLNEVFGNLISNAFRFTSGEENGTVRVWGEAVQDHVEYTIQDTGCGFDMAHEAQIWEVFRTVHASDERSGPGAGLAIVKRIIDRHGGKISVDSEVGKGAKFTFNVGVS